MNPLAAIRSGLPQPSLKGEPDRVYTRCTVTEPCPVWAIIGCAGLRRGR